MIKPESDPLESLIPLPPEQFMELVCGGKRDGLTEHFLSVGKRLVAALHEHKLIQGDTRMLDVGCACGRVARFLLDEALASYTGFDRHSGMIEWCRSEISSKKNNFRFFYFDIKSSYKRMDGLDGKIDATRFHFPFDESSFDFALLSSVFTHMPLEKSQRYLSELSRTLAPGGKALLSVFLTIKQPYIEEINYYYSPSSFHDAVTSSGLKLTSEQCMRLKSGSGLGFDNRQHNWFVLQNH